MDTPVFDLMWRDYADKAYAANNESWLLMSVLHDIDKDEAVEIPW